MDHPRLEELGEQHTSTLHTYVSYRLERSLRKRLPDVGAPVIDGGMQRLRDAHAKDLHA